PPPTADERCLSRVTANRLRSRPRPCWPAWRATPAYAARRPRRLGRRLRWQSPRMLAPMGAVAGTARRAAARKAKRKIEPVGRLAHFIGKRSEERSLRGVHSSVFGLAMALSGSVFAANYDLPDNIPQRKPGLWEMVQTGTVGPNK